MSIALFRSGFPQTNLKLPGDVSAMALWEGLQHSPPMLNTLSGLFVLVKPCYCRAVPHAHYPYRADIGREGWVFFIGDLLRE